MLADIASAESDVETSVPLVIPAGTQSGTETTLGGRGVPSLRGTGRGDLLRYRTRLAIEELPR